MSVKDYNKVLIVSDSLNGNIIDNIDLTKYKSNTISIMLYDLINDYVYENEHGLLIKVGYKN